MTGARKPVRLAVSVGCPCGIGPEVSIVAALAMRKRDPNVRILLVGDLGALRATARSIGLDPARLVKVRAAEEGWSDGAMYPVVTSKSALPVFEPLPPLKAADRRPAHPGRPAGAAQLAWIDAAADLVTKRRADALVTGPVSKDAIASSGAEGSRGFFGHTEHLAARLSAREVTMAFHNGALTTSLVTTHLPLSAVARAIRPPAVSRAVFWTAWFVDHVRDARKRKAGPPRIAIAALNPHAGERGLLGAEEERAITPGIALARRRIDAAGIAADLVGPIPAETAFRIAQGGGYEAVVAMYHDQATIPMKLLGFGEAVNVSLGLPIIRTSVDHGTAYDRAGKGTADARGMIEAMLLAARLVRSAPQR